MTKKSAKRKKAKSEPDFVSDQVSEARRYYLNLNPSRDASLAVVCGGVERTRSDYLIQRDRFPYFGIEMVTEGLGQLTLQDNHFALTPGMMFAYGPSTSHRIVNQPPERMRKFYVDFSGRSAKSALVSAGLLNGVPLRVTRMNELVELFEMLDHEARSDSEVASDVCEQLLRLMLVKVRQCCLVESGAMPRSHATYERVRGHIETHFLRLRTVEEIAAECDITPIHLSRLFRRFGGVGAYRFLQRKKMNHAAEMLVEGGLLIKDVAERLGYSDAFQFSRAFKRVYGIPPKQLMLTRRSSTDL